jgi:glycosyltransferase involved in cell wall biosynthesis
MSKGDALSIWMLQTGEPLHIDAGSPRPMRAMNLSDALLRAGHRVVLWSTAFHHQEKRHRSAAAGPIRVNERLEIRLIPSRGYRRNIGVARLLDHAELGINLRAALRDIRELPHVAFVGYPPIETAAVLVEWLTQRGVPTLLDVKDQWPTIFADAAPAFARPLAVAALWPYFRAARRAMRTATALSAMSESFLEWALGLAGRARGSADGIYPLTSRVGDVAAEDLAIAGRWWDEKDVTDDGRPRVMFAGTHSEAFDFEPVQHAARLTAGGADACEWVICGDGPITLRLHAMMAGLDNVRFAGWIDRPKLVVLAERSMAALAPYRNREDFRMSLPNKVLDALSLGLPILSPLQGEVAALLAARDVGLRYDEGSGASLARCVAELAASPARRARIAANARETFARSYSADAVYGALVKRLEELAGMSPAQAGAEILTYENKV